MNLSAQDTCIFIGKREFQKPHHLERKPKSQKLNACTVASSLIIINVTTKFFQVPTKLCIFIGKCGSRNFWGNFEISIKQSSSDQVCDVSFWKAENSCKPWPDRIHFDRSKRDSYAQLKHISKKTISLKAKLRVQS